MKGHKQISVGGSGEGRGLDHLGSGNGKGSLRAKEGERAQIPQSSNTRAFSPAATTEKSFLESSPDTGT